MREVLGNTFTAPRKHLHSSTRVHPLPHTGTHTAHITTYSTLHHARRELLCTWAVDSETGSGQALVGRLFAVLTQL